LLHRQALDPGIGWMALQSQVRLLEPLAQGFGVDAKHAAHDGKRDSGHHEISFLQKQTTSDIPRENSQGKGPLPGNFP
jgi:hypothetical protein